MTPSRRLRQILAVNLCAAANCCDQMGMAARETLYGLALIAKPGPKRRPRTPRPSWLRELEDQTRPLPEER